MIGATVGRIGQYLPGHSAACCCQSLVIINARVQLPASLRAVDSVADAFHVSASRVGSRVYGHPGGLTVRERYILAEKREAHLKQTREVGETAQRMT